MKAQGWWLIRGLDLKTRREVWREQIGNGITDAAANNALSAIFTDPWYVGLITGTPTLSKLDTMSSKAWTEYTGYTGNRPLWDRGAPANGQLSNAGNKATFTLPGGVSIGAAFLVNGDVKGSTSDDLWATGLFKKLQVVTDPQVVEVLYSLRLVDG